MILYTQQDVAEEVRRITRGEGVAVVYNSVDRTTFEQSLNCLRRFGYLVLSGQSSDLVPALEPARLASKSLFLTRPKFFDYIRDGQSLLTRARAVLDWVAICDGSRSCENFLAKKDADPWERYFNDAIRGEGAMNEAKNTRSSSMG